MPALCAASDFRSMMNRGLRLAVSVICFTALSGAVARGHAVLVGSEPSGGMVLSSSPSVVRLLFNERVEIAGTSIRVFNAKGEAQNLGEVRLIDQGQGLEAAIDPSVPLTDGGYAVLWRVHSLDGHQVQGQFGFGVGGDAPSDRVISSFVGLRSNPLPSFYLRSVKWISLLGLAMWLGAIFFLSAVLLPVVASSSAGSSDDFLGWTSRGTLRILTAGAGMFAAGEFLSLVGQAAVQGDLSLAQTISPAPLATVLAQSHYGHWWIVRMVAAAGLMAFSFGLRGVHRQLATAEGEPSVWPGLPFQVAAFTLGAVILVSIPMTGHAGALSQGHALAVLADWLHLAATVVWIGGLVCLGFVIASWRRMNPENRDFLARLAQRFSWHARICVVILFLTGAYSAWQHLPDWNSFLSTDYGRTLLGKLALLVPLLAAAFANLRWVVPTLASTGSSSASNAPRRLLTLVRAETIFGVAILAAAAVLTQLPPATAASPANPGPQVKSAGGFEVELQLTPQTVGPNRIGARLRSADGAPITTARRVTFYLRMLDMDMGLQTIPATRQKDGSYAGELSLPMAGKWQVSVEISPPQGDTFVTEFEFQASAQSRRIENQ